MVNSFLKSDEISRILRDFYSRPYARGDIFRDRNGASALLFLLTPLREGRPATEPTIVTMPSYFYSRPYARGDLKTGSRSGRSRPFLLTPLREGRHVTMMAKECVRYISTHAPARGATGSLLVPPACQPDFYSRPYARGDRRSGCAATWRSCYFYSRPYARGDLGK